jgi:arylsulfatase A-like enzyme
MAENADDIQRQILPIPDRQYVGLTTYDARDPATKFPPITPLRPPKGAPNVLIILLDDVGFGASSAFGGPINTPTAERLAAGGLKFNRFHTTALCSPTRQAMLTGRNHHSVNMGGICEIATSAPGYSSVLPKSKAPLPEILKLNGYSTAQFGKCHEVPVWETSPMGPFTQWPTGGGGFEYFYGFIGGETNQWYPAIYEGTTPVEQEKSPEEGYHFTEDLTDKAIKWVRQQKSLMGDKPFFMYFAPGACHAPHHVPKEWADKYKGKFDQGWDKLREEIFARQKKLGVIPANAELTKPHEEIPAWDAMPKELKPILAREMEVYAGFLEHADHHIGRLVDTLKDLEVLDDTLIYYIIGDNGASAEGTINGSFNEMAILNGMTAIETPEFLATKIDDFGGPKAYNNYAVGWAHALDTHTSGRSKSHRIGAARATAPSSIGRKESRPRARFARSSITSSTWRRLSWKPPACRIRPSSIACSRRRSRVSACSTPSTMPKRPSGARRNISRCSATAASTTRAGRR